MMPPANPRPGSRNYRVASDLSPTLLPRLGESRERAGEGGNRRVRARSRRPVYLACFLLGLALGSGVTRVLQTARPALAASHRTTRKGPGRARAADPIHILPARAEEQPIVRVRTLRREAAHR